MSEAPIRRIDTGTVQKDEEMLAPPVREELSSPLDSLRAALTQEYKNPPIVLEVKTRPGVSVRFNTNIDSELLQAWRRRAQNRKMADGFDGMKFACTVIGSQAEVFLQNGVEVTDNGTPVNFRHEAVQQWTKTYSIHEAIRSIYGVDGHVLATCGAVLDAAGFADDIEESDEDPTPR